MLLVEDDSSLFFVSIDVQIREADNSYFGTEPLQQKQRSRDAECTRYHPLHHFQTGRAHNAGRTFFNESGRLLIDRAAAALASRLAGCLM